MTGNPYGSPDAMLIDVIGCDLSDLERHYNVSLEKYRVERVKPGASHGGKREGAGRRVADEGSGDGDANQGSVHYLDSPDRGSDYYISRLKRDAETDAKAAELLEAIREGDQP